jgi:hypothetical protein
LQCGQRSGSLIGERCEGVRALAPACKTIRLAEYQASLEFAKRRRIFQGPDLQKDERALLFG